MANWDDYDEITSLADDDTALVHDVSEVTVGKKMKKITWANIKAMLATKASAAEVLAGTDDAKFLTPLSAKGLPSIFPDSTPDSDHLAHGVKAVFTANENQAFGDVCYINADTEMAIADADGIATAKVAAMCADATINADASGNYLLMGVARDDTWNWTPGGFVYLSTTGTTGNTLTQTAPSGTDDCVVIVGVATHADRILFNPQLVIVEHT